VSVRVPVSPCLGVVAQSQHLAEERNGLLPQALRVADVAVHDFVERVLARVLLQIRLGTGPDSLTVDSNSLSARLVGPGRRICRRIRRVGTRMEEGEWTLQSKHPGRRVGSGRRDTTIKQSGRRSRPRLDLARLYDDGAAHRVLHRRSAGSLKTTTRPTLRQRLPTFDKSGRHEWITQSG